ncbi:MAG TPA: cupredoxin domain-containing protein [Vicinamibacterales bacterium]|nr:cupredoxin domain-containing protein [Vicinamibacterales bacterium]
MSTLDLIVATAALALIALINWFFFGKRGTPVVAAAASPGGVVDVTVRIEGGYSPSTIEVPAGSRVRLTLDRREDNPCSDEIVIADFGIRKPVPAHGTTAVEFTATPGRHEFTCGMGMLHGSIIGK